MAVTLFDESSGVAVELSARATPAIAVAKGPRAEELAAVLRRVLDFHGLTAAVTLAEKPPTAGLWVRPAPLAGAPSEAERRARGFADEDWSLYLARVHYRVPLTFSWDALAAARAERADLLAVASGLAGASAESSSRGVVGYRKRFADRLAADLDLAEPRAEGAQGQAKGGVHGRPRARSCAGRARVRRGSRRACRARAASAARRGVEQQGRGGRGARAGPPVGLEPHSSKRSVAR